MTEGSRHFEEDSAVFKALHNIAQRLKTLGIPYAVVGGMALFQHGLRRFTEDVDILVTKGDLKIIHEKLDGLGYIPPFTNSKHLRDTQYGVKIEFLTTGDYPGDGKIKPVSFPDPGTVSVEFDGISYINLPTLVELKLASGMTNPGRLKDLSDVMELIKILDLPVGFSDQLDPYVSGKFTELWKQARKRYVMTWRNDRLTAKTKSIEDLIATFREAAQQLAQMQQDGIVLDEPTGDGNDSVLLVTTDAKIAEKYGLIDESDHWGIEHDVAEPEPPPP